MLNYVPPFSIVKDRLSMKTVNGNVVVNVGYDDFLELIQLFLRGVQVDEAWYLEQYPDVRTAIEAGEVASAKAHFVANGYFEGRLPFSLELNDAWYTQTYPDIGAAIERGEFASALHHFREFGYAEGRLPDTAG